MRKTKIGVLEMVFLAKLKTLMFTKTHNLNNEKKTMIRERYFKDKAEQEKKAKQK